MEPIRLMQTLVFWSLVAASSANATELEFAPSNATVQPGSSIAIDIIATPEAGELIGGFDFIVHFNPSVLAFGTVTFGPSLNDDPFFCALNACRGFSIVDGDIFIFEGSLVFPLSTLQDGSSPIVLASVSFDAAAIGTSDLSFTGNILGQPPLFDLLADEFGGPLPVFAPGVGQVTVEPFQMKNGFEARP